jgi:hypothetical protein
MDTVVIIIAATILSLIGSIIALLNWCSIIDYVLTCRRNPRYANRGVDFIPLLGGLLLTCALGILVRGFPHIFSPKILWLGLVLDYGTLPAIIITPMQDLLLKRIIRKKSTPKPRGPYCRKIQLPFPLLLETEAELRLICSTAELPPRDADFLQDAPGSILHGESDFQIIAQVHSPHQPGWWNRLRHRNDTDFWQIEVEYTIPRPCKPDKLRKLLARYIREDDDIWTQFHDGPDLQRLLKSCASFREILALGCLAGWWEIPANNAFNLPQLNEDTITEADIRQAADSIRFQATSA